MWKWWDVFSKREVLCTNAMGEFVAVENLLKSNQIDYQKKLVGRRNAHGFNMRTNLIGSFGERMELETQYYLYVRDEDKEEADYLIQTWRQNR